MNRRFDQMLLDLLTNRVYFLLGLAVIVVVVMSSISPYFFDWANMLTMMRLGAVLALVGMGQSLVILAGGAGIDLSVGGMLSLSGVVFVTAGILVASGRSPLPDLAGYALLVVGLIDVFVIPPILVRKWRTPE